MQAGLPRPGGWHWFPDCRRQASKKRKAFLSGLASVREVIVKFAANYV
ncbi:hypothetical protein NIES4073_53990 [Kalymmatonema gypsitolerans NIES-4073]|nr:hypothetical protein NIES4073_53990 [Scytonema sp. NIES-4073]